MDEDDQLKDADDVLSTQESVAEENEDEQMRPAGEAARIDEAGEANKRIDETVEGDEPESPEEGDTGAQS